MWDNQYNGELFFSSRTFACPTTCRWSICNDQSLQPNSTLQGIFCILLIATELFQNVTLQFGKDGTYFFQKFTETCISFRKLCHQRQCSLWYLHYQFDVCYLHLYFHLYYVVTSLYFLIQLDPKTYISIYIILLKYRVFNVIFL